MSNLQNITSQTKIQPLPKTPVHHTPTEVTPKLSPVSKVSPELLKQDIESQKSGVESLKELTSPDVISEHVDGVDTESLMKQLQTPELEQLLSESGLGDELEQFKSLQSTTSDLQGVSQLLEGDVTAQNLSSTVSTVSRISELTGDKNTSGHLGKVTEILSTEDDVNNMLDLVKGEVNTENLKSTATVLDTTAKVLDHSSMRKVTKSILAPVNMLHSGKETVDNIKEMWDDPSLENLKELGKSSLTFTSDLAKTVELLPGGTVATSLAKGIAGKTIGRLLPVVNGVLAVEDTIEAFKEVKEAFEEPTLKNISEGVVSTLGAAGSIALATNIPIVSQIGLGVVVVTDFIELAMDKGFRESVGKVIDKVGSGLKSISNTVSGWFGFGSNEVTA